MTSAAHRSISARARLGFGVLVLAVACSRPQPPEPPANSATTAVASPAKPAAATTPASANPPLPTIEQTIAHGHTLFDKICAVCHGMQGQGYVADRAPALANREFLASVSDALLRRAITLGRPGTTMSAWSKERGGPLAPGDVDALIVYMRSFAPGVALLTLDEKPRTGDAKRGAGIYARECARCHGPQGNSGLYIRLGDVGLQATASDGFFRHALRVGRPGTPMEPFEAKLGAQGIEDVLAFIRSWPAAAPNAAAPVLPDFPKPPPLPLGPVPLNPNGPEPRNFQTFPATTKAAIVHAALEKHARLALLDARTPSDYATMHIAGAVSVPYYDPTPYLAKLPKNAWLVAYCSCPHAESGELAKKLMDAGFKKVTVLDEGLGFWQSQGYAVRNGDKP